MVYCFTDFHTASVYHFSTDEELSQKPEELPEEYITIFLFI